MTDDFRLTIELGNEAMQTPEQLADALEEIAQDLRDNYPTEGKVRDINGNTIGEWAIS